MLRVIKTAQSLGFTLDEVADVLDAGVHRHSSRPDPGLQARAQGKIAEINRKIHHLTVIRESLQQAVDAGCDDLIACAGSPFCPLPFHRPVPPPRGARPQRPVTAAAPRC